jgi:membrane fusion protein
MNDDLIFRSEVLPSEDKLRLGSTILIPPLPTRILTILAALLIIGVAFALALVRYTRHVSVQGVIVPAQGVVKLYAQQSGELRLLKAHAGTKVRRGEVLMVFATERRGSMGTAVEQDIARKLRSKLNKLMQQRETTLAVQSSDLRGLQQALDSQIEIRRRLEQEVSLIDKRGNSAKQTAERYEDLRQSGFVTEQMAQDKRDEQLEQQLRLQSARKDIVASEQEIERLRRELESAPERQQVAIDQIDRDITTAELEVTQEEAGHEWSLTAPCDCIVSSLDIGIGQTAFPNLPLISLLPIDTRLQAKLYAPSRALGFVTVGQNVNLKLDAFPFEKFGAVPGHVESIAETPLTSSETGAETHLSLPQPEGTQEPLYCVTVTVDQADILVDGKFHQLQAGMQLNADVELETRPLYQWMIRPLYDRRQR